MNYDEIFRAKVIESLRELSDEAFQRRVWLASSGPEVSSFVEAISGLFDDTGLGDILERPEQPPVFSPEIYDGLRELSQLIGREARSFQSLSPHALIEHPKMREIRTIAGSILARAMKPE